MDALKLLAKPLAEKGFKLIGLLAITTALLVLSALLIDVMSDGLSRLNIDFLTSFPSRRASEAGIYSALVGTFYMILIVAAISLPLGVGAAIYLQEYAPKNKFTHFIEVNIANLAGVPSIIYGLLGLQVFVRFFSFDRSLIAGACTMSLLILPVIIIAAREAIRRVPMALRQAAFALGASKWEVIRDQVLPVALPGVMTGCILAFSRAIGETAPLIAIGALTYVAFLPDGLFSPFSVLPIQTYNWISRPQAEFHINAAGAICVLLGILLVLNLIAVFIRSKFEQRFDF